MTADEFRELTLSLPEAVEGAHMGHADFRVGGKIFASLGYPDADHGMVILPPEAQTEYLASHPKAFARASGAWGVGSGEWAARPTCDSLRSTWRPRVMRLHQRGADGCRDVWQRNSLISNARTHCIRSRISHPRQS